MGQPRPLAYQTGFIYNWSNRTTSFNYLEISFVFLDPVANGGTRGEENWELLPGRQEWGHIDMPTPVDKPLADGVVIRREMRYGASGSWSLESNSLMLSNTGPQSPENYVEITKVEPDATSPDHLWVTGRLSVDLYNFLGQPMQQIRNAEFRGSVLKPKLLAERAVWPPKIR